MNNLKIICIFYGIGRGLEISEPSIINKIITPLKSEGHQVFTYYFRCEKNFINNPRSGEIGFLNPIKQNIFYGAKTYLFTEAELFRPEIYEFSKIYRDSHGDNYISNKNLIYQLSLLQMIISFVNLKDYDRVIVCRDDLYIAETNRLKWSNILAASSSNIVVSMWHWNLGVSERFFIAPPDYAYKLLNRIDWALPSIMKFSTFNAELLQKFVLSLFSINIVCFDFKFYRVRLSGKFHDEKFIFPSFRPVVLYQIVVSYFKFLFTIK
jgi:hypothetical protein